MVARDVEIPDTSRIPKPDIQNLKFLPGIVNGTEVEKMLGTITGEGDDNITTVNTCEEEDDKSNISSDFVGSIQRESNIEVTQIKSFQLSQKDEIRYMFSPEPDVCLLKCTDRNSVKHSNGTGQIKHSINLGTKTDGFTVTTDNRLLFCCTHQECIKEMELPSGEIIEKIDTSPLIPNCICTGPSGDIYVTLYDEDGCDVTEDSTRVLDRYNRWGRKKKRCKNDRCGRNIFVLPDEICVNNTGTRVAVINKINERRSELILLDKGLRPVLIYRGPSVITGNVMGGFELTGVIFDSRDNILTTEVFSNTVQLLSPSCEPLKTLMIMDTIPCCMTIHGNEVWVGDNYGNVVTFRYSY
ncbi:uncharacterized protein LOC117331898 [Pecten maximus]|uniref:uncharacterized protein LOC117331898 n=1 Tax=Pecten maximus TaxID=6579 RepID=UPI001458E93D|nr:uncharacterized protein LOC117331898 [Pecten maximus]